LVADDRPVDPTPVHTADLPATPLRDRNIPASAWMEAPAALRQLGEQADGAEAHYKRRIGRWLLWRAGPARRARACYLAVDAEDLSRTFTFALRADGSGAGTGPDGVRHERFRTWKQSLLEA
jgi:hypothetical protein